MTRLLSLLLLFLVLCPPPSLQSPYEDPRLRYSPDACGTRNVVCYVGNLCVLKHGGDWRSWPSMCRVDRVFKLELCRHEHLVALDSSEYQKYMKDGDIGSYLKDCDVQMIRTRLNNTENDVYERYSMVVKDFGFMMGNYPNLKSETDGLDMDFKETPSDGSHKCRMNNYHKCGYKYEEWGTNGYVRLQFTLLRNEIITTTTEASSTDKDGSPRRDEGGKSYGPGDDEFEDYVIYVDGHRGSTDNGYLFYGFGGCMLLVIIIVIIVLIIWYIKRSCEGTPSTRSMAGPRKSLKSVRSSVHEPLVDKDTTSKRDTSSKRNMTSTSKKSTKETPTAQSKMSTTSKTTGPTNSKMSATKPGAKSKDASKMSGATPSKMPASSNNKSTVSKAKP